MCHPYEMGGIPYYDGALGVLRVVGKDGFFAGRIQKKYPKSAGRLRQRAERYNWGVALAKQYEAEGKVLIVEIGFD